MQRDQPSTPAQSRAARARDKERFRQIEADHAERSRHLHRSPKFQWEVERDDRAILKARIAGLEHALALAERQVARQAGVIKSLRHRKNILLRDEVLAAVKERAALMPRDILVDVEASYGSLGKAAMRTLMRILAELKEASLIRRVPEGYVRSTKS